MATKLQQTPTTNLFALLAEEQSSQPKKKPEAAPPKKVVTQELTPAARAAAKAEEERKKKEAAEKKTKQAAASTTSVNPEDLEGFGLQRNQRVKEKRLAQEPPKPNKDNQDRKFKGKPNNKNVEGEESKPFKELNRTNKPGFKGPKEGTPKTDNEGRPRTREFDRQSQGKFSRQAQAKKQGHGKGNWGDNQDLILGAIVEPAVADIAPVESAAPVNEEGAVPPADETQALAPEETPQEKPAEPPTLDFDAWLELKAQKQKELEAHIGAVRDGPRSLTEEEKRDLNKFTIVQNTKNVSDSPSNKGTREATGNPGARKGEKAVAVETFFNVSAPRFEGRGRGRGRGRGNRDSGEGRGTRDIGEGRANRAPVDKPAERPQNSENRPRTQKAPGGPGRGKAQKIFKNDVQFPSLG